MHMCNIFLTGKWKLEHFWILMWFYFVRYNKSDCLDYCILWGLFVKESHDNTVNLLLFIHLLTLHSYICASWLLHIWSLCTLKKVWRQKKSCEWILIATVIKNYDVSFFANHAGQRCLIWKHVRHILVMLQIFFSLKSADIFLSNSH